MVSDARKKMLEKVRAILAKTMDNGCTEEEAMTALAKARELMATYEISEEDVAALDQETVKFHRSVKDDPYEIKTNLKTSVGKFTRCRPYLDKLSRGYGVTFVGLESDVIFAKWLLETLQQFVMRALREYQKQNAVSGKGNSNHTSASFVIGCVKRIAEKLKMLTPVEWNVNKALIEAELEKKGIVLRKARAGGRNVDQNAARAGHAAGNSATFNKPVGAGGMRLIK